MSKKKTLIRLVNAKNIEKLIRNHFFGKILPWLQSFDLELATDLFSRDFIKI